MAVISLLLVIATISGCSLLKPKEKVLSEEEISENKSKVILKCFDDRDVETLKTLFCEKTKSEHNLESEIEAAFDLFKGKSISYEHSYGNRSGGNKYGVWYEKKYSPKIKNIVTDDNQTYEIRYKDYYVFDKEPEMIGIVYIVLYDSENNLLARIG